ncbi:MAG: hypothetical protein Q7R22_000260 [Verrucomicrobiota bacterium JB025]|nr:hypothetical protein [Verrucomicrobiota bacterium JB025]
MRIRHQSINLNPMITLGLIWFALFQPLRAESIEVRCIEKTVASRPKGKPLEGEFPRSVLMLRLEERGEYVSDPSRSSYWVFDPEDSGRGLRKIFGGPGSGQYLRFLTPLHSGWGLASGRLDSEKEPESEGPWFWYNLLDGEVGPEVDLGLWTRWNRDDQFVGEQSVPGGSKRITSYLPDKAMARTLDLDFSYLNWLEYPVVIGVTKLGGSERVVQVDVEKLVYQVVGSPPPDFTSAHGSLRRSEILPAGKDCRDGIYAIQGFSLLYQPKGGNWKRLINDVPVSKTFGGSFPWLPVHYVGNNRFAIAKTVKNEVDVPDEWPESEKIFGAAEAVTCLVDGMTGKIVKGSKPYVHNHNPPLRIPESWWTGGESPEKESENEDCQESLFRWSENAREIRFGDGQVVRLGPEDERLESDDGRMMFVFQKCPSGSGKGPAKMPFRILDGDKGTTHKFELKSRYHEVWTEARWLDLEE